MWQRALGRFGGLALLVVLAGCAQAPLEPVTEPPAFASGRTNALTVVSVPNQEVLAPRLAPASQPAAIAPAPIAITGADPVPQQDFDEVVETGGLTERLPNTCKLENYQQFVGESAGGLANAALDRAWRVVGPDTIITQEYNPARLNFRTDGNGTIQQITCG